MNCDLNFKNFKNKGQSLIELIIGLGIGIMMIGAVSGALLFVSRSTEGVDQNQLAGSLVNSLLDNVAVTAEANWGGIYGISKGSANQYFVVFTGTTSLPVLGRESMLSKDISDNLIGHWKFDEAGGVTVYDSSRNYNNGTLINGPTRMDSSDCKAEKCLSTNVSKYIDLGNSPVLNQNVFTFVTWIKPSFTSNGTLFGGFNSSDHAKNFIRLSADKVKLDQDPPISGALDSSSILGAGNWYHIAVVQNGAYRAIYINGVLDISDNSAETYSGGAIQKWVIGRKAYDDDDLNYYRGLIDDVRLYKRALTPDEIAGLYNSSVYSRYFYTDNVSRDANQNIETTYNPANDDPSTQKITVKAEWLSRGSVSNLEIVSYLTRWANNSVSQTDWSGGGGASGPVTDFGNRFDTSTDIDFSSATGSIKISGI